MAAAPHPEAGAVDVNLRTAWVGEYPSRPSLAVMIHRLRAAWQRRANRFAHWRRRNGFVAPRPRWPGIVYQGWGWYDGLSSLGAAAFSLGVVLFLFATAMYLLGASALVSAAHEAAEATAAVPTSTAEPTAEPPTDTPEPSPTLSPPTPTRESPPAATA